MIQHATVITGAARSKSVQVNMGDVNQGGSVTHMFAPIQALKIKSISRKAVQDFLAEREAYEDAVDSQPEVTAVSYRSCFQASYLKSLVKARMFGQAIKELSDLNDDILKAKLQELAGGYRTVSCEQALADVKRNVKLDATEPDARLRILMLSASYIELCEKMRLAVCREVAEGSDQAHHLCDSASST